VTGSLDRAGGNGVVFLVLTRKNEARKGANHKLAVMKVMQRRSGGGGGAGGGDAFGGRGVAVSG
jgi:hypothetical protein